MSLIGAALAGIEVSSAVPALAYLPLRSLRLVKMRAGAWAIARGGLLMGRGDWGQMGTVLGAGDCVPLLEMELQCNGQLPSDVAKREAAQIRIEECATLPIRRPPRDPSVRRVQTRAVLCSLGALSCIEQTVKSTIALSYFVWCCPPPCLTVDAQSCRRAVPSRALPVQSDTRGAQVSGLLCPFVDWVPVGEGVLARAGLSYCFSLRAIHL